MMRREAPATVFMFSGQGTRFFHRARDLFETNAVFRDAMRRLDELAFALSGRRLLDGIRGSRKSAGCEPMAWAPPAIFMLELSLARCLAGENVKPDLVLGAGVGAIAAAVVAGCVREEHGMALALELSAASERTCEPGGMTAVTADPARFAEPFLCEHSELAAINFHSHFVVSAPCHALDAIEAGLKRRGIVHQRLAASFAFHSRWIDPARERFCAFLRGIPLAPPAVPLVCCEQGAALTGLGGDYFWRVARRPIRFRDAIGRLERQGTQRYIDLGPSGTLASLLRHGLPLGSASTAHSILAPFGRDPKNIALLAGRCSAGSAGPSIAEGS